MAAFNSNIPTFDLSTAVDPMEVYPDAENHPADDDGVDIDLDLTADRQENLDDDEMIEDLEADAEDMIPESELVQDERMTDDEEEGDGFVDGATGDVYEERYEQLDDIEPAHLQTEIDQAVDVVEEMPYLAQSGPESVSQNGPQHETQLQNYLEDQSGFQERSGGHAPLGNTQWNMNRSIDGSLVAQDFPGVVSAELSDKSFVPRNSQNITPDRVVDHSCDTHPSSLSSKSVSQKPPPSLEEEQPYSRTEQPESLRTFSATIERNPYKVDAIGEAPVQYTNHDLKSSETENGLGHSLAKVSHISGADSSETYRDTQDDPVSHTDIPRVPEDGPDETGIPGSNSLQATRANLETSQVHPVTVNCQGREMYLFPPTEEQTQHDEYLLSDEGLAAEGLQSLFKGFRDFLGESISDAEDLEITFDNLDLSVCEVSQVPNGCAKR